MKAEQTKLTPLLLFLRASRSYLAYFQCLLAALFTGEIADVSRQWIDEFYPQQNYKPLLMVALSGVVAFFFNLASFQANKHTSPLTMCIAGNFLQVSIMILSTICFDVEVTSLNALGIAVTLAGSAWYSYTALMEKEQSKQGENLPYNRLATCEDDTSFDSDEFTGNDETEVMLSDDDSDLESA